MKKKLSLALIREEKVPCDERAVMSPEQARKLLDENDNLHIVVQSSPHRRFADDEYRALGLEVMDDVSHADVMLGVKEVPSEFLIPNKTYLIFSHTIKKQMHNLPLMRAAVAKKITLIDWECFRDASGKRLIGFGHYAGLVGTYNAIRLHLLRNGRQVLQPAQLYQNKTDLFKAVRNADLAEIKLLLTGTGNVAKGALEMLRASGLTEINPTEVDTASRSFFTHLEPQYLYEGGAGQPYNRAAFYENPSQFVSALWRYTRHANVLVVGHYWKHGMPELFAKTDVGNGKLGHLSTIADISCDIPGSVPSTLRASTIAEPYYGVEKLSWVETSATAANSLGVMAVDNLPCSLPRGASTAFGHVFSRDILPLLLAGDDSEILARATLLSRGEITEHYRYLLPWVMGEE